MKSRKIIVGLILAALLAAMVLPISAADVMPYASGNFSLEADAGELVRSNSTMPLAKGEKVTIKAVYSPYPANVDIGILDSSSGTFYYQTATDGLIDATITVQKSGNYYLAVRNNSDETITLSGTVRY